MENNSPHKKYTMLWTRQSLREYNYDGTFIFYLVLSMLKQDRPTSILIWWESSQSQLDSIGTDYNISDTKEKAKPSVSHVPHPHSLGMPEPWSLPSFFRVPGQLTGPFPTKAVLNLDTLFKSPFQVLPPSLSVDDSTFHVPHEEKENPGTRTQRPEPRNTIILRYLLLFLFKCVNICTHH